MSRRFLFLYKTTERGALETAAEILLKKAEYVLPGTSVLPLLVVFFNWYVRGNTIIWDMPLFKSLTYLKMCSLWLYNVSGGLLDVCPSSCGVKACDLFVAYFMQHEATDNRFCYFIGNRLIDSLAPGIGTIAKNNYFYIEHKQMILSFKSFYIFLVTKYHLS